MTGHQRRAGGRTGWGHMVVGQADRLLVKLIEARGLQYWIAVAAQVAITLVVGEN